MLSEGMITVMAMIKFKLLQLAFGAMAYILPSLACAQRDVCDPQVYWLVDTSTYQYKSKTIKFNHVAMVSYLPTVDDILTLRSQYVRFLLRTDNKPLSRREHRQYDRYNTELLKLGYVSMGVPFDCTNFEFKPKILRVKIDSADFEWLLYKGNMLIQ
jgi:hypothetical protein